MRKSVFYLTVLVAGLLAASVILASAGLIAPMPLRQFGYNHEFDPVSFSAGMLTGLTTVWLAAVPWSAFPRTVLRVVLSWRRNFILASLATACAGVLLFY